MRRATVHPTARRCAGPRAGADPAQRDESGRTALAVAEAHAGTDVELLLTESLIGDGPVEVRRRGPDGARHSTSSETGHARIAALLPGA